MAAPVQAAGSPYQTAWTGTGTKTAGGGVSVGVGDLIVVLAADENFTGGTPISTPSNTGSATVTWTARGTVLTSSFCEVRGWTGSVTGAGTLTVSSACGSNNWGYAVYVFPSGSHGGVGQVPAGTSGTAAAPTATATWAANSFVAGIDADWAAGAIATRAYRANIGAATELNAINVDGNYSTYAFYHADSGSGGSQAVGMTAPTQTYSLVAIEVLGTGAVVEPPLVVAPVRRMGRSGTPR